MGYRSRSRSRSRSPRPRSKGRDGGRESSRGERETTPMKRDPANYSSLLIRNIARHITYASAYPWATRSYPEMRSCFLTGLRIFVTTLRSTGLSATCISLVTTTPSKRSHRCTLDCATLACLTLNGAQGATRHRICGIHERKARGRCPVLHGRHGHGRSQGVFLTALPACHMCL
jgi:hypothetical protein